MESKNVQGLEIDSVKNILIVTIHVRYGDMQSDWKNDIDERNEIMNVH